MRSNAHQADLEADLELMVKGRGNAASMAAHRRLAISPGARAFLQGILARGMEEKASRLEMERAREALVILCEDMHDLRTRKILEDDLSNQSSTTPEGIRSSFPHALAENFPSIGLIPLLVDLYPRRSQVVPWSDICDGACLTILRIGISEGPPGGDTSDFSDWRTWFSGNRDYLYWNDARLRFEIDDEAKAAGRPTRKCREPQLTRPLRYRDIVDCVTRGKAAREGTPSARPSAAMAEEHLDCLLSLSKTRVVVGERVPFIITVLGAASGKRRLCATYLQDRPHRWIITRRNGSPDWSGYVKMPFTIHYGEQLPSTVLPQGGTLETVGAWTAHDGLEPGDL